MKIQNYLSKKSLQIGTLSLSALLLVIGFNNCSRNFGVSATTTAPTDPTGANSAGGAGISEIGGFVGGGASGATGGTVVSGNGTGLADTGGALADAAGNLGIPDRNTPVFRPPDPATNPNGNTSATGDTLGGTSGGIPTATISGRSLTDYFTVDQTLSEKVDILFVVDNSPSMNYEQQHMAEKFNSLIGQLGTLDYRIGVITTDVKTIPPMPAYKVESPLNTKRGQLLAVGNAPTSYFIDSVVNGAAVSAASIQSAFASTIQRPETGDWREQPQGAVSLFLDNAKNAASNEAKFFRPGASFAIVVVTDTDETSIFQESTAVGAPVLPAGFNTSGLIVNSPDTLATKISLQLKRSFSFHAIIVKSGDNACLTTMTAFSNNVSSPLATTLSYATCKNNILAAGLSGDPKADCNYSEAYGRRQERLAMLTNGVVGSVCAADYAQQLGDIGLRIKNSAQKAFTLQCVPAGTPSVGYAATPTANPATNTYISALPAPLGNPSVSNRQIFWGSSVDLAAIIPAGQYRVSYTCQ